MSLDFKGQRGVGCPLDGSRENAESLHSCEHGLSSMVWLQSNLLRLIVVCCCLGHKQESAKMDCSLMPSDAHVLSGSEDGVCLTL